MDRRSFGMHTAATLAGLAATGPAWARYPARGLEPWLRWFKSFPGTTSFRIDIGRHELASDSAADQLFVASSIKTFILGQYLRDVEEGALSEDEQLPVNDSVRTAGSPVLVELTGTTPARSILEAMITNTFFPEDTVGYGKGGSGDWVADRTDVADFHALSYAGQMVVNATPVTFCFVVNWSSVNPDSTSDDLVPAFTDVVKGSMTAIKQMLRR